MLSVAVGVMVWFLEVELWVKIFVTVCAALSFAFKSCVVACVVGALMSETGKTSDKIVDEKPHEIEAKNQPSEK